ncbi:MAG: amidase [Burkholderiales bacterium]
MSSILDRDTLNAFCRHTHAEAKGAASGPLAGLTCGIKDIYSIAGYRTGFGSPEWLETHPAATQTSSAVQRLLDAGASVVGKTQTDELTYSLAGENAHYGTPVNPAAPGRIPGGSSSGSAAATAGKLVDFALGSDTGGSVRTPASFCGVFGMRPSHGRIPLDEASPLAHSFDTAGWFTRDAALLETVGRVLLASTAAAKPVRRVLLAEDAFAIAGPEVGAALAAGVERVGKALGKPQSVTVSAEGLRQWFETFKVLQGAEVWAEHGAWIRQTKPVLGPGVRERIQWAATLTPADVAPLKLKRDTISRHMTELLGDDAVLVLPTVSGIAPLLNSPPAAVDDFRTRAMSLLCIAGLAGLPQASLPLGTLDGCPLGLSLIGPRGGDEMVLATVRRVMG